MRKHTDNDKSTIKANFVVYLSSHSEEFKKQIVTVDLNGNLNVVNLLLDLSNVKSFFSDSSVRATHALLWNEGIGLLIKSHLNLSLMVLQFRARLSTNTHESVPGT